MKPEYRMPAEWEPHEAVWLAWPWDKDSFGYLNQKDRQLNPQSLPNVEKTFIKIIDALQRSEKINVLKKSEIDYQDVWTRDYMPSFVKDQKGSVVAIKWRYDAYGSKFTDLIKDNEIWSKVNQNIPTIEPGIVLEPGAIEVNGDGVLLTTERCLLKRNPTMSKANYEKMFLKYLGVSRTIWLKEGIPNDHTDGHIDEIARFVSPDKILCVFEQDYELLKKDFEVTMLPLPQMVYANGEQAPASYANFYIANKVVLVPTFQDPNDQKALQIIQSCFPNRKVIGIDCVDLIYGGGTIHCVTQQQPRP